MKFARPQEFLDLCERLKETKPDFEAVKQQVLDLRRTMRYNIYKAQGQLFEYLVGNTIARIAKDYGARQLQLEDAYLFEPYELQLWGYGCKLNDTYTKKTYREVDVVLKAGPSQIWLFEVKSGNSPRLINYFSKLTNAICDMKPQFSFANVTLREKYERRRKSREKCERVWENSKNRLEEKGIVMTYLRITKQELCEFVEDVYLAENCLQRCFRDLLPARRPPRKKRRISIAEKYLGDFYKPEKRV